MGKPAKVTDVVVDTLEALNANKDLNNAIIAQTNGTFEARYNTKVPSFLESRVKLFERTTTLFFSHGYNQAAVTDLVNSIADSISGFYQYEPIREYVVKLADSICKAITKQQVLRTYTQCRAVEFDVTTGGTKRIYKAVIAIDLADISAVKGLTRERFQMYDHLFMIIDAGPVNNDGLPVTGPGDSTGVIGVVDKPNGDQSMEIGNIVINYNFGQDSENLDNEGAKDNVKQEIANIQNGVSVSKPVDIESIANIRIS